MIAAGRVNGNPAEDPVNIEQLIETGRAAAAGEVFDIML
jgi:hypothetical protein